MLAIALAALLQGEPDPLTRLGKIAVFSEYAFGRNAEPIDGDVYLSPDGRFIVGQSPTTQAFGYRWFAEEPTRYVSFAYGAAYDPKMKRAVIYTSGTSDDAWLVFGRCLVVAVLSDQKVLVQASGRDRTGVGRTVIGIVTPGEARGRVLMYLRRQRNGGVFVGPDGTVWSWDQDLKRYREATMGSKYRTLPKGLGRPSFSLRYILQGNFEIDRKTGARTEVLQRNDRTQYWGDHLIITRDKEFFLWDRSAKKLVSLGPAMPVMGKDYTGKRIVFRTDTRKGVVRQHKMLIIDR